MDVKKKYTENSGWDWFLKTSVVWILVILFFAFLAYRYVSTMLPGDTQGTFTDILLKITVLVIVIGLFLNFFILQN